jgi:hypothetical protein
MGIFSVWVANPVSNKKILRSQIVRIRNTDVHYIKIAFKSVQELMLQKYLIHLHAQMSYSHLRSIFSLCTIYSTDN